MSWDDRHGEQAQISVEEAKIIAKAILESHARNLEYTFSKGCSCEACKIARSIVK